MSTVETQPPPEGVRECACCKEKEQNAYPHECASPRCIISGSGLRV